MAKVSNKYLEINPFKIIERGLHVDRYKVSESIFSLANEYMGVRGFFEEGSGFDSLIGTYVNGIYDYAKDEVPNAYLGIMKKTHFTLNVVNFLKVKIECGGELLDLSKSDISDFYREFDMKTGLLTRSFVWKTKEADIKVTFERLLDMVDCVNAVQRISFESNKDVAIKISFSMDNNVANWGDQVYWKNTEVSSNNGCYTLTSKTTTTNQSLASSMVINSQCKESKVNTFENEIEVIFDLNLKANIQESLTRFVVLLVDKKSSDNLSLLKEESIKLANASKTKNFSEFLDKNAKYYEKVWQESDIKIEGNDEDQQGIRYCIFQLNQTYHGYSDDNNIGAKGLTGEAYSGHAFWDSETYCLPYYLFSNKQAALNLLMFRYTTLPQALERSKMLDCEGACYPIATRNGVEGCTLWQHASCQIQPTTAVGYAIFHYMNLYHDVEFMNKYGLEMLLQICKFLLSRGQYNQDKTGFGYYGVMGPDEFQMMVNNNTYTNFMAKKIFDYTFSILDDEKYNSKDLLKKCGISSDLLSKMKEASNKMIILFDKESKLFEQHDGFYKLPHVDIHSIPVEDFPLYSHWSYDRIYRNDVIKQPDVLMFMFLYMSEFDLETKKANYEYYEPRCIHESSLSPSIHSIFAEELGKEEEALKFFDFATRLDLDDYNRNTCEGLHLTSIAAAWMNIVYGFLGLRSDGKTLSISPKIPSRWKSYSVSFKYLGRTIKVLIQKEKSTFEVYGDPIEIFVNKKLRKLENGLVLKNEGSSN